MPTVCTVIGCKSRGDMPERKFFRFPMLNGRHINLLEKSKARQIAWLNALQKPNFLPHQYPNARVCNLHFISGKSAHLHDVGNPDWIPTLNMGPEELVNPQFSSATDAQIAHFISGMNVKLQDLTNPDWEAALKFSNVSNEENIIISDDESDSSQIGALESTLPDSTNRIATISSDDHAYDFKKPTPSMTEDSNPSKSAEVFRNKNGQFSFLCIHCNTFSETCDEMIDHINSHFDSTDFTGMNFEELESPEALPEPEFINCDSSAEVKIEPEIEITHNEHLCELTNTSKPSNVSEVLEIKSEVLSDSEECGFDDQRKRKCLYTNDESKISNVFKPLPTASTIQRNSPRPPNKYQLESKNEPKCYLQYLKDLRAPPTFSDQLKSNDRNDKSNIRTPILRIMQTNSPRLSDKYQLIYNNDPNSDKYHLIYRRDTKTLSKDLRKPPTLSNQFTISKPNTLFSHVTTKDESTTSNVRVPKLRIIETDSPRPRDKYQLIYKDYTYRGLKTPHIKLLRPIPIQTNFQLTPDKHQPTCENYSTNSEQIRDKGIASRCYQCEMEPPVANKSDPRRHKCLLCQEWFSNHIEFNAHFKNVHNKDTDEFFSVLTNCYEFTCYICEKNFQLRDYLSNHMKIHHDKFLEHQCPDCGKRQRTFGALTQHMKIHEGKTYKCNQCEKTFPYYAKLCKHLWCHKTELDYVCKLCSKGFKMKKYLNRHMAVHAEAKICCRFCDASFKFSTGRRIHEKNVHKVL